MLPNFLGYMNVAMFMLIIFFFAKHKFKEYKQLSSIFNQIGQISGKTDGELIWLDHRSNNYSEIDSILSDREEFNVPQTIFFLGPKWLYEIKKKTWKKHITVHESSLTYMQPREGFSAVIIQKKFKYEIIYEVAEYLNERRNNE
ncbi:hypothetical protein ACI48J_05000 [Paenibacillus chitinolyticus]|uniref:hypothetical protein n=1 Tax=Paenibacillus chitinolyticus TaxID=79263 RepID=UPI00386F43B5